MHRLGRGLLRNHAVRQRASAERCSDRIRARRVRPNPVCHLFPKFFLISSITCCLNSRFAAASNFPPLFPRSISAMISRRRRFFSHFDTRPGLLTQPVGFASSPAADFWPPRSPEQAQDERPWARQRARSDLRPRPARGERHGDEGPAKCDRRHPSPAARQQRLPPSPRPRGEGRGEMMKSSAGQRLAFIPLLLRSGVTCRLGFFVLARRFPASCCTTLGPGDTPTCSTRLADALSVPFGNHGSQAQYQSGEATLRLVTLDCFQLSKARLQHFRRAG